MKIPTKFSLNTVDYKIYFDNEKKTYVCEDPETGEKTNIGVLGTFLQMGILKPLNDSFNETDQRIAYLMDKVVSLEERLSRISKFSPENSTEHPISQKKDFVIDDQMEEDDERMQRKPLLKKHSKPSISESSNMNQKIMEKILEKTIEEEKPPKNVKVETNEEIENWMEI